MGVMSRNTWLAMAGAAMAGSAMLLVTRVSVRAPARRQPATRADSGYVDAAACAGCHAEIVKSYLLTGMGRSLYRLHPESQVEDFKTHNRVYNRASDRYYTMLERDGKW